jgi:hypothetical protein
MFRTTKSKIIGLILAGVVALGGATYATTALADGGATAAPATVLAAQTTTDPQLRASILDMLKDRMGLTGANAERFADQMIARMQNIDPNFDFQAMINWCNQYTDTNTNGWGMMGGNGSTYGGWGMTGGGAIPGTPSAGSSNPSPSATSPRDSGSGFTPRGTMGGGGMMGASGLR